MRTTQRAPQACRRCAVKKMRCSKTVPCDTCVKQGLAQQCHRETVIVKKYARPQTRDRHQNRKRSRNQDSYSPDESPSAARQATAAVLVDPSQQESHQGTPINTTDSYQIEDTNPKSPRSSSISGYQSWTASTFPELDMPPSSHDEDASCPFDSTPTSLEVLVWGRQRDAGCPPVAEPTTALFHSSQEDILPPEQAIQVLKFHWKWLAWAHNVINWMQFREECQTYWGKGRIKEKAWLALYYAVLCVSQYLNCYHTNHLTQQYRLAFII